MTTLTASTATPHATLPAPTVEGTLDGGLGYDDLKNRNAYTYVRVGPLLSSEVAAGNTKIVMVWAGKTVKEHIVTQTDLDAGAFAIPILNGQIIDIGDGSKAVTYTAYYLPGSGEEHSGSTSVIVKRSVPGGLDPHPETPVNDNLTAATVSPNPVLPGATEVIVSVPLWINAAAGDVMAVIWNGSVFEAQALVAPFPDPFALTLTAAQVLEAGTGPGGKVEVTWTVRDVVGNWSGYAPYTTVDVQLEDPGLVTAPHIGSEAVPWTQIDLATLGSDHVSVFTPVYTGAAAGDSVIVHASGTALDGKPVSYDSTPQIMDDSGYGLTFTIPNTTARDLADSTMRIWYTVAGKPDSHSVRLLVVGAAQGQAPAPFVAEAVDTDGNGVVDRLYADAANPANITIDYPGMTLNDAVTLVMDGTNGIGEPVRYSTERRVTVIAPLNIPVIQNDVLKFLDGQMDVYYRVVPFSLRRRLARGTQETESAHLTLQVRRDSAIEPHPAPTVLADDKPVQSGSFLDPATKVVAALAIYLKPAAGDEITYTWVGAVTTRTQSYLLGGDVRIPADYTDREFIDKNTGGIVTVSYTVKRIGGSAIPSEKIKLRLWVAFVDITDFTSSNMNGWVKGSAGTGGALFGGAFRNFISAGSNHAGPILRKEFNGLAPDKRKYVFSVRAHNLLSVQNYIPIISLDTHLGPVTELYTLDGYQWITIVGVFEAAEGVTLDITNHEATEDGKKDYELDDIIVREIAD